ncbi:MAG: pseudouridine synthase, partial [Chthoniobacterales bacterium]
MNTTREIIAEEEDNCERLDLFLVSLLPNYSSSRVQALIKEGHVTLQGDSLRCRYEVRAGDHFLIEEQPEKPMARAFAEEIPLTVLYEDDDLLIIDKPAGMVVHVGPDHEQGTLVNALLYRNKENLSSGSETYRPGIVHRLDKETSGC